MSERGEFDPILPPENRDDVERGVHWVLMTIGVVAVFGLIVVGMMQFERSAAGTSGETASEPEPIDIGSTEE